MYPFSFHLFILSGDLKKFLGPLVPWSAIFSSPGRLFRTGAATACFLLSWYLFLDTLLPPALTCSFNIATYFEISIGMDSPLLLIVAAMLMLSRGVQPCTHANSMLCSMCYLAAPLVACYWPVPGLFRLVLACSWLVPLVLCFSNVERNTHIDFVGLTGLVKAHQ